MGFHSRLSCENDLALFTWNTMYLFRDKHRSYFFNFSFLIYKTVRISHNVTGSRYLGELCSIMAYIEINTIFRREKDNASKSNVHWLGLVPISKTLANLGIIIARVCIQVCTIDKLMMGCFIILDIGP